MNTIFIRLIIILTIFSILFTGTINAAETTADELACELNSDGWTLYGTDQCPWCIKQRDEFGDAFTDLAYINCQENKPVCIDAGIKGIPCWVSPNGTLYPGYHNLTQLDEMLNDYRAEQPTPPAIHNAAGFELMYVLMVVLIVLLIKRR